MKRYKRRAIAQDAETERAMAEFRQLRKDLQAEKGTRMSVHEQEKCNVDTHSKRARLQEPLVDGNNSNECNKRFVGVCGVFEQDEVGRVTLWLDNRKHVIRVYLRASVFIVGRHRSANLVLPGEDVSNIHGKIYAIQSDLGERMAVYEDHSTNGTTWNVSVNLKGKSVILNDGDSLLIGQHHLVYTQVAKAPEFDPAKKLAAGQVAPSTNFAVEGYKVTRRLLGSGTFSIVRLAVASSTGHQLACKVISKEHLERHDQQRAIVKEIKLMKDLSHPNIVCLRDAAETPTFFYIFIDLHTGGDMQGYLVRKRRLEAPEAKFVAYQIAKGLKYLHVDMDIAHGDLKLENVVLRDHGPYPHVLLADFGTSLEGHSLKRRICSGTVDFWPPECLSATTSGAAVDCWALGCVIFLMLTSSVPFEAENVSRRGPSVHSKVQLRSSGDERTAQKLRSDLHERFDAGERAVAKAILSGSIRYSKLRGRLDKDGFDLLHNLLAYDPRMRLDIEEALKSAWFFKSQQELDDLYAKTVRFVPKGPLRST